MKIKALEKETLQRVFAPRPRDCHKGSFGTVALFGGSVKYSGAVKLANLAASAMRAGAGVVRLTVPEGLVPAVIPYLLESTLFSYREEAGAPCAEDLAAALAKVRGVGCGMGWEGSEEQASVLRFVLSHAACPVLVDAGGLRVLAREPALLRGSGVPLILTPHPGEFSVLTGKGIDEITASPAECACTFARSAGCTLVLKGSTTLVTDGNEIYEVNRGGAGMATAGSGDVLAGVLTGMLGYTPPTPESIACGVYLCGLAGEIAEESHTDIAMVASDTVGALPAAVARIRAGEL